MTAGSGISAKPSEAMELSREGLSLKVKSTPSRAPAAWSSALTMDRAMANLVRHCHVDLLDAVWAAATTPANLLGLTDRGRLERGARADVVVLDPDFRVESVWVGGEQVR